MSEPEFATRPQWYDRDGVPCDLDTFVALMRRPDQQVGLDQVDEDTVVSTVFLGVDLWPMRWHLGLDDDGLPTLPPMIYETAILTRAGGVEVTDRTPTEAIARAAHQRAVDHARSTRR